MGRATSPPPLTGHAVVRLKTGETYVAEVVVGDRLVTIDGSLRVTERIGDTTIYSFRAPKRRTVPVGAVAEIRWDDDDQE